MDKQFNFINVLKDADECLINKFYQNTKKYAKKFFNQKEKLLTLQHLDKFKLKVIFKKLLSLLQKK
jgi:hypothetical protein